MLSENGEISVNDLEALAARVEAASEPTDELFTEVWRAVDPKPAKIWEDEDHEEWTAEYENWAQRQWDFQAFIDAKAWLDAAVSLVPEGWGFKAEHNLGYGTMFTVGHVGRDGLYDRPEGWAKAATPALALTAACLRARAQEPRK